MKLTELIRRIVYFRMGEPRTQVSDASDILLRTSQQQYTSMLWVTLKFIFIVRKKLYCSYREKIDMNPNDQQDSTKNYSRTTKYIKHNEDRMSKIGKT